MEAVECLLQYNICVCAFDFTGSGLSEGVVWNDSFDQSNSYAGDIVTLGTNEQEDLKEVVAYLRSTGRISKIGMNALAVPFSVDQPMELGLILVQCQGLWGRSMGAVSCLLYAARDPSMAGMVLDSPFSSLPELIVEIAQRFAVCSFPVLF